MEMETRTLKFTLELEIEIDGKEPCKQIIIDAAIDAMNESMPSLILDSEELDCNLFTKGWEFKHVK